MAIFPFLRGVQHCLMQGSLILGSHHLLTEGIQGVAHRKVYLAVGRTNTRIYRFDPIDGDTRVVDNVAAYKAGYTAMGAQYRGDGKEPLLLAVSDNKLVTIDVEAGAVTDEVVDGLPSGKTWYDGDTDVDGKILFIVGDPDVRSYSIDVAAKKATPGHKPGSGRWDDFAHHPKDGRLDYDRRRQRRFAPDRPCQGADEDRAQGTGLRTR